MGMMPLSITKSWLFCVFLLFALLPDRAAANSAPIIGPGIDGPLLPIMNSEIEVQAEELTFTLEAEALHKAQVDVHYTFVNPTPEKVVTQVAFPYSGNSSGKSFQVTVDGKPLQPDSIAAIADKARYTDFLHTFQAEKTIMVDPVTGEMTDDWKSDRSPNVQLVVFPLTFAAQTETDVQIRYEQTAGTDNARYINPIKFYQYELLPASAWKKFQRLHVTIIAPGHVFFAANLPFSPMGEQDGTMIWEATFTSLPKTNLAFSLMTQEGLLWNIASKDFYDTIGLLLVMAWSAAATLFLTIQFNRKQKWWLSWLVGPIATSLAVAFSIFFLILWLYLLLPVFSRSAWLGTYGVIFTPIVVVFFSGCFYIAASIGFFVLTKIRQRRGGKAQK